METLKENGGDRCCHLRVTISRDDFFSPCGSVIDLAVGYTVGCDWRKGVAGGGGEGAIHSHSPTYMKLETLSVSPSFTHHVLNMPPCDT